MIDETTDEVVTRVLPDRLTFKQWLCRALPPILSYRLGTRVFLRNRRLEGKTFVTSTITGALFSFNSDDLLAAQVQMCGFWDWRSQAIAAIFCTSGDTIIEVGANTGTETVGFAEIVRPGGKVIAFEPLHRLAEAIRYNGRINGFDHIETIEAAVSDFNGFVQIREPTSRTNSGQGHIAVTGEATGVTVPAMTLDSVIDQFQSAKLVLIDVEGHELAVLRGAREFLRRTRAALIVEAVAVQLMRAGTSLTELAGELDSIGYTVFQINRLSISKPDWRNFDEHYHLNWLCIPNERTKVKHRVNAYLLACALLPGPLQPLKNLRLPART
jgi:FkbM family methyltransferase